VERYYHFICGGDADYFRMAAELGISDKLRWRRTKMGFFCDGVLYSFSSPLDLLRFAGMPLTARMRYGLAMAYVSKLRTWKGLDSKRAERWLIGLLGDRAYRTTWYPLLSVKFPGFHQDISAAWAWHRVHRLAASRKSLVHPERLGYLEGGTQTLVDRFETLLRNAGVNLRPTTPVRRIVIDNGAVIGLETGDGKEHRVDRVVSAVPLPVFLRMMEHHRHPWLDRLARIDFIGVICIVVRLRRPVTEYFWTNIHDPRIPFNGIIEYTNLNAEITGDGSALVYLPHYLPRSAERFRWADERLFAESFETLSLLAPRLRRSDVLGYSVSRDPYAQVICRTGFLAEVPEHRTPFAGLYLIESSQLYPSDRTISGTLAMATVVAKMLEVADPASSEGGAHTEGARHP
jgi:protoporphyrinogen oxidase